MSNTSVHNSHRRARLFSLPLEVLTLIVERVEGSRGLANFARVCKALHEITLPILYRDISFKISSSSLGRVTSQALSPRNGGMLLCRDIELVVTRDVTEVGRPVAGSEYKDFAVADMLELLPPHQLRSLKFVDGV
jgi:hypothetical protein